MTNSSDFDVGKTTRILSVKRLRRKQSKREPSHGMKGAMETWALFRSVEARGAECQVPATTAKRDRV